MSQPTVQHRPHKATLSRRQLLLGLGAAGAITTTIGACGGLSVLAYVMGRASKRQQQPTPTAVPTNMPMTPVSEPPRPEIVSREEWGAWAPDHEAINETGFYSEDNPEGWLIYEGELQDHYQTVIIHHAAFYEETDLRTMEAVQTLHRVERGWADIAYHFLVGRTGAIYEGRDWAVRGTHVESFNTGSLGICLLGNFMQQQPTDAQLASTQRLLVWLAFRLTLVYIAAHRQFNTYTECPGDNLFRQVPRFAAAANLRIGIEGYLSPDENIPCTCCACNEE